MVLRLAASIWNRFKMKTKHFSECGSGSVLSLQLAYCIVQFLEKDPTLTEPVSRRTDFPSISFRKLARLAGHYS